MRRRFAGHRVHDTCEARISDLEVASKVLGTWIMNEEVADVKLAGALTGTDAVDLRQHVPCTADRPGVGRQAASHTHPPVPEHEQFRYFTQALQPLGLAAGLQLFILPGQQYTDRQFLGPIDIQIVGKCIDFGALGTPRGDFVSETHISIILLNFTPIGVTVAEISVTEQIEINVKKLQFRQELTANDTSKTAKITKR